ncbi:uncharacterized protein LOC134851103 [Symsagittifera roscoffensis]|uniref:uncharacterized protein LOC134851103 n=1 Tax=Symsagittifera roscoffensis TaxID=84072 RepID=UPI00307C4EC5
MSEEDWEATPLEGRRLERTRDDNNGRQTEEGDEPPQTERPNRTKNSSSESNREQNEVNNNNNDSGRGLKKSRKRKSKKKAKVRFASEEEQVDLAIAPVADERDGLPVTSDEASTIADWEQTTQLLSSTLQNMDDEMIASSLMRTQYIDIAPNSDQFEQQETQRRYSSPKSRDRKELQSFDNEQPNDGNKGRHFPRADPDPNRSNMNNSYVTMHGGKTEDGNDTKVEDDSGRKNKNEVNDTQISKRTVNEISFDTTYQIPNNETTIRLNRNDVLEESETPASTMEAEIYGMTESPGNYGEIDTPLLEPQIISLPRSEVTLVLVNIGCPETYQQDFQDLIREVNNVQILGQFFVVSDIRLVSSENPTSAGIFSKSNQDNLFVMALYDATKTNEDSLKRLRSNFEKVKLPREHILLCGICPEGTKVEENFDVGLFALKNKMLHKICHLTFPAVSQSIEWAIRMRLDSTSQITLVPSRSTPGSPVVNRLVSDKHFDSVSVNHKHDIDLTFSVCLIGPPRSGKSNIVQRFVYNSYQELYQKTIGADFHQKDVRLNHKNLRLQMWDFGKGFETIVEDHLVSARCVIAVFDHTSRSSLESLSNMLDEYSGVLSDKVLVIAGTKSDLNETDIRKSSEIQCVAERFSAIGWFPVSSKTGEGCGKHAS